MEYALTADHHRVHAFDAEKGQAYYCPVCGNQVIPRQGEVNSWHFAHVTSCVDDWKYDMSEWHRNWQNRFPESTREVVIEYKGESHRADILTGGYVIEFQHSPITSTEFERRNLFYTKAGYKVIWVFDETEAYANEYIIGSGDNCDKFVWKWPNRAIASVVPQFTSDVAIIFQLIAEDDENDCDWLVKAEWAIAEDDTYADYRRFFIDDGFTPDLFSPTGLRDIMLNKRRRFEAFLRNHSPYEPKCKRMKGNPRSWYICEKTKEWHDDQCLGCRHNLITEYRKGTDYRRGGRFYYCDHYHPIHLEDVLAISKCPPMTSQFLRAFDTALQEGDIDAARDLLIRRERLVKQNRAKLNNPKSYRFERPIHYYKLDYRFGTASTIINDILTGLEA